jgi:hypothetical protein
MARCLAAILLVVVIATAAKSQNPAIAASQVEMRIEPPAAEALLISRPNMTSRPKTSLQRSATATRDQGAVWSRGSVYDLARTGQASIYVFYTPDLHTPDTDARSAAQ